MNGINIIIHVHININNKTITIHINCMDAIHLNIPAVCLRYRHWRWL